MGHGQVQVHRSDARRQIEAEVLVEDLQDVYKRQVFSVVTAFDLSVSPLVVGLVSAVSSLLFSGCFLWKKALLVVSPAVILLVVLGVCAGTFSSVGPTVQQLVHDILTRFSSAYPNVSFSIPQEPPAYQAQSLNLLFSLVLVRCV